ncbi:MAG: hypothetical protein KAG84_05015 [Bacteroidales bacterium]|nr:hypothetical protein [Bacteroidales bacterium]
MKKLLLLVALLGLFATACKKDTDVSASMTWNDSQHFDLKDKWKVCIYEGAITFISDSDFDNSALETINTTVGASSVVFTVNFKSFENYTVVAFFDINGNGKYDKGENAAVKFETVEAGEATSFDISIDY